MKAEPTYLELKKELEELKKRDKSQVLLDYAGVIFIELDMNGNVSLANKKACEVFGYEEKEMLGKNWFENFLPERIKKEILPISKKLLSGEMETAEYYENPILTKTGEERLVQWHNTIIRDNNGNIIGHLSSGEDITEHKKADEEIKRQNEELIKAKTKTEESESKFKKLSNLTFEGIVIHDKGIAVDVNLSYTKMFGYTREEIIGKNVIHLNVPKEFHRIISKNLQNEIALPYEIEGIRKDGSRFPVELEGRNIDENKDSTLRVVAVRDITEQIKVQEENKKLSTAINQSANIIIITDTRGDIEYTNPKFTEITGYSKEEVLGKKPYILKSGALPDKMYTELWNTISSGKEWRGEFYNKTKEGKYFWESAFISPVFNSQGKITNYLKIAEDITERKLAEEALKKSEDKFKIIYDSAPDAIYLNDLKGNFIDGNKAAEKLLGYKKDELIGKSLLELKLLPPKELFRAAKSLAKNVLGKKTGPEEFHLFHRDGSQVLVEVTTYPVVIDGKKVVLGVAHDITERKQYEKELKKLTTAVEQSANTIVISDIEGNIEYTNPKFTELTGYTAEEALGQNARILNAGTQPKEYYAEMWKTIADGKTWKGEFHNKTKKGDLFWEQVTITPIKNEDGKIANFLAVKEDITARREAEKALKESEEKYRRMIETSNDLIWMHDASGKTTFFNKQVEEATGYILEEWIGKSLAPLVLDKELPILEDVIDKALKGTASSYEFQLKIANGSYIILSVNTAPMVFDNVVTGMFSFARDITQQKQDEQKIKNALVKAEESELRFRALHDATFGGIAIHDKGMILDCNLGLSELSGYTVDELIGMDGLLLIAKDSRDKVMENILAGYEKPYEAFGVLKNGEKYPVRLEGRMIPYKGKKVRVVEFRDITYQKEAEMALVNSEAKQGALIENISDVIAVLDGNGIVKYKSPNIKVLFGWEPKDLVGKSGFRTVHKDDMERVQQEFYELLLKENSKKLIEYQYKCKNGLYKTIHCTAVNLVSNPKIEGILLNYHDISQQKISEINLKDALEKAKESDRLKSAFLANMSHEIRTPMNGILGFSSLLKEPGLTGDQQQKYIQIIEKSGNRMLSTINDIIDISRIESGQIDVTISEVNINEQIEYLNTFFKPEAEKKGLKLTFKRGLSTQESIIKTDREKFYSILTNLVKNAIKYSHKGSIEFGYYLKKESEFSELEFYVKDTGIGIPKERQKAIFERFVQADIEDKDVYEGSGLGLAISNSYAEMLGGTLRVESEVGIGSTFYFTIPYNTSKKMILRKEESSAGLELQIKKLKILIADDEETAELYLTLVLSKYNKEFLVVKTGGKAVEACRNNPDIDLVLMDIRMPDMNGYEATRQIRKFNKDVVIIAQTAFGLVGDKEKAIEAGCNDYISKPIKKIELLEMIERIFKLKK